MVRAWSFVLLGVAAIWLLVLLYIIARNFSIPLLVGLLIVSISTYAYLFILKKEMPRPWTVMKLRKLSFLSVLYSVVILAILVSFALRGKHAFLVFATSLFLLYMVHVTLRGWYCSHSTVSVRIDMTTFVALVLNIGASIFSLHDLLASYGSGVLADAAIVLVIVSTASTKHSIISSMLDRIASRLKRRRRTKTEDGS